MRNEDDGIQIIRFSNDFKNRAGRKSASFFFAEDAVYFFILLPIVLLTLRLTKAGTAAFVSISLLPAGFWLLTLCRMKPRRLWKSILLIIFVWAATTVVFLATANYASAAAMFFGMIVSFVKTAHDFSRLYEETANHESKLKGPVYHKKTADFYDTKQDTSSVYLSNHITAFAGIISFVVYLLALRNGYENLAVFCVVDFTAIFVLMAVYNQKSGAYCLSQWDIASKTESGGKKAEKAGSSFLAFLTAAIAAAVSFLVYLIAQVCGKFQLDNSFIANLERLFNMEPKAGKGTVTPPDSSNDGMKSILGQLHKQPQRHSLFTDILGKTLTAVLWCIIIAAVLFALAAIGASILRFYRKLNLNVNEESRSLLSAEKTADRIKSRLNHVRKARGTFFRRSNRSAIRRLFYLHIRRRRGKAVRKSDTPQEIGGKVGGGGDMKKAAEIYEKARYSNNVCENTDVREMRQALSPNRHSG